MKQKLKMYRSLLIAIIVIIFAIILYYFGYFYIATIILAIYVAFKEYLNIDRELNNNKFNSLTDKIKANINDNISNMSYPIALIDNEGNILWANKRLKEELNLLDLQEQNILSIGRNLDLHKLLKCDKDLSQRIKIKDSFYSIYANNIGDENIKYNESKYLVYFNEVSNLRDLYSTRESIMLIEVDNLSEALERTDETNRPMLAAEVEKEINSYSKKLKAMIVKYEYNKYCLSVQDKYINDEINCKFNILDKISSIDRGNKLEVTLSIGIGRGGDNPQENYNNAMTARELALGRGGDQVVIKNNEKISFFGGNTRELEKELE